MVTARSAAKAIERALSAIERAGAREIEHVNTNLDRAQVFSFTLEGDRIPGRGRVLVKYDGGELTLYHINYRRPWLPDLPGLKSTSVAVGGRTFPAYTATVDSLLALPENALMPQRAQGRGVGPSGPVRERFSEIDARQAGIAALEQMGYKHVGTRNGISYLVHPDSRMNTPSVRLIVGDDGLISCWCHSRDLKLPAPWRAGKEIAACQSYFVSADKLIERVKAAPIPTPKNDVAEVQRVSDEAQRELFLNEYKSLTAKISPCRPDHRHLIKGVGETGNSLPADGLFVSQGDRRGAIVVPMYRLDENGSMARLSGAQLLLPHTLGESGGADKMMLRGSRAASAFTPLPVPEPKTYMFDMRHLKDKARIVICEGVATGIALQKSLDNSTQVVVAFSSGNLKSVAEQMRRLAPNTQIVIASDNDISLDSGGALKSNGIPHAIETARAVGGRVAYFGRSYSPGFDARDLYARDGASAVRRYIDAAQEPDAVQQRLEALVERKRAERERAHALER
jgi:hypothetical protein